MDTPAGPDAPVFVFPGQGAQRVGMGRELCDAYPVVRRRFFGAADEILGLPLTRLCFEGPEEDLARTEITQPALLVTGLAVAHALELEGLRPGAVAGHSLGEYAALVTAGVLSFPDALRLVRRRGELMAEVGASTRGVMSAVLGLPVDEVEALCRRASDYGPVSIANYNGPHQHVVSGVEPAVAAVEALAEAAGAQSTVRLKVSAPFHCPLMAPLRERFAAELEGYAFADPALPVVANVTADYVRSGAEARRLLCDQLAGPVRWTEVLLRLYGDGFRTFVEPGPARVLTSLDRRIVRGCAHHWAGDPASLREARAALAGPVAA